MSSLSVKMIGHLFILACILNGIAANFTDPCITMLMTCISDDYDSSMFSHVIFHSEETLAARCGPILQQHQCARDHLLNCESEQKLKMYEELTEGWMNVITELCNDTSELRSSYRIHNPCLINLTTEYRTCLVIEIIKVVDLDEVKQMKEITGMDQIVPVLRLLCRIRNPVKECMVDVSKERCGEEAGNFLQVQFQRFFKTIFENGCALWQ